MGVRKTNQERLKTTDVDFNLLLSQSFTIDVHLLLSQLTEPLLEHFPVLVMGFVAVIDPGSRYAKRTCPVSVSAIHTQKFLSTAGYTVHVVSWLLPTKSGAKQ